MEKLHAKHGNEKTEHELEQLAEAEYTAMAKVETPEEIYEKELMEKCIKEQEESGERKSEQEMAALKLRFKKEAEMLFTNNTGRRIAARLDDEWCW